MANDLEIWLGPYPAFYEANRNLGKAMIFRNYQTTSSMLKSLYSDDNTFFNMIPKGANFNGGSYPVPFKTTK